MSLSIRLTLDKGSMTAVVLDPCVPSSNRAVPQVIPQGEVKSQQPHEAEGLGPAHECGSGGGGAGGVLTRGMTDDGNCHGGRTTLTASLGNKPEMIWEEDCHSYPSRTSSTSGYRENCSLLMMPMGSSDENSSSPVHRLLTNSSSTIVPIDSPESLLYAAVSCSGDSSSGGGGDGTRDDFAGSQRTIVTYEHEDTLL